MRSVHNGAQEASRLRSALDRDPQVTSGMHPSSPGSIARSAPGPSASSGAAFAGSGTRRQSRSGQRWLVVIALAVLVATSVGASSPSAVAAAGGDLLMSRSELLALPTSGSAWTALKAVADAALPAPNLCDQNANHHLRTLAAAAVYARTGIASYGAKARAAIMSALPTQTVGCSNAVLALGRQLAAYVVAADLAGLSGTDDATFRTWLSAIRTKDIGGHPIWNSLVATHRSSPNNWGAYAGAARIAADVYLGDATDLDAAARITRGFLGDRSAYAGFTQNLSSAAIAWSCTGNVTTYTPVNGACTKSGINLDGGAAADISRGGGLRWPPADPGIPYQLEAIQGLGLQVELLSRHGYADAWSWSGNALKRMAAIVTRSASAGGTGWNGTITSRQMPWLLNLRYGTSIPTAPSGMGRAIGFTDWFYGSGSGSGSAPKPTPTPTPKPTPTPAPTPTPPPSGGGSGGSSLPTLSGPVVRLAPAAVPSTGSPVLVRWALATSADGVRRYDLQVSADGGSWATLALATLTTTSRWVTLRPGHDYRFRARAIDRSGLVGGWTAAGPRRGSILSDSSSAITYRGSWGAAAYATYLGGHVHYTRAAGPTATYRFSGSGVIVVGPKGPGRGRAAIYIDGTYVATVDALASSFAARRMLFVRNLAAGTHTITIKALGTAGRPVVAIDAIEVLAPA